MNGFIVYSTYSSEDEKTTIQLFGRLENGQSFVTLNSFKPYFFVRKSDEKAALEFTKPYLAEKTLMKNFKGEEVVKISFRTQSELNEAYKKMHKEMDVYEADLKPNFRFLMEKKSLGKINIEGEYESSEKVDRVYREPKITASEFSPKVKIVSIDTEADMKGNLFCAGICADNYQKNFMITSRKLENTVSCKTEEECLRKFRDEILKLDPDIITGWNVIDFDFVFLRDLFRKHKIEFDIGRTNENPRLRIEKNFFRSSSVDVPGRQVLDGLNLVKDPFIKDSPMMKNFDFKSLTLEDVSQEILKKGKLIKGKNRHEEIMALYKEASEKSLQRLADYNLMDCKLVLEILEKTKLIELALERSQLTGITFDRLMGSVVAFDSLYMREAHERGLVSPSMNFKEKEERIEGGYVSSLNPGIYKNVLVLDFKSLYPSIIRTFNIDPASFLEKRQKDCIESPNGACFKNEEGVLPAIIERLHRAREKAKKEKRMFSSQAIKIIMNSFFGVLASPNCRYFSLDIGNAITHFGQFIIKLTAKEIETWNKELKVLYSDTDSVFVETNLSKEKANKLGAEIPEFVNKFYKDYVKKNYNRESFLDLQFEKQYIRLMIPKIRGQEKAAKKRYAGLVEKNGEEVLEVVGLEAIRGDWTEAAQEFQVELLKKLFHDEEYEKFIQDYIKKIRDGKLDDKLVYRKSIRKELEEYTKTTPPHVKAARKLKSLESNIIEYYVTTDGPEPIQNLKHKLDYEHYIEKQIKPIVNQILAVFNKSFEDVAEKSKQTKLF
jgi:DNA polymerase II